MDPLITAFRDGLENNQAMSLLKECPLLPYFAVMIAAQDSH